MDTHIACLTPPGKAAIATLVVRGPHAWDVTRQLFQPHKGTLGEEPIVGRFWYGLLGSDSRDEVILAVKEGLPRIAVELHCHGGVEVVRMIQELYEQQGVRIVSWQQMLDSPVLAMLAQAPTVRTAAILLDQAQGDVLSYRVTAKRSELRRLQELIPLGQHLVEPWRVVIAGAPNVGKSSLMNALAGYARSVVSSIPGTTRDVVTIRLAIDGWLVEMTDTAGLRESSSRLEHQGIERALAAIERADLRIWLLDGSAAPVLPDDPSGWCTVINKIDLPAAWDWRQVPDASRISAQTGAGLPELCEMISRRLVPHPPAPGEAVPCLPEQIEWVGSAIAKEQGDGLA